MWALTGAVLDRLTHRVHIGEGAKGRTLDLRKAQAAIADQPELKGKVRFVRTVQYWDPKLNELNAKRSEIAREQRGKLKEKVAAEVKEKLEGKDPKKQREILDNALGQAVRNTAEYKAWQAEWDKIGSHWECHYFGSGKVYSLIGYGLGEAMKELISQGK